MECTKVDAAAKKVEIMFTPLKKEVLSTDHCHLC
jgi:hypothetical protein